MQVLFDSNTATLLYFLNVFLTDEFFQLTSGQKNFYAEQFIEANPESPTSKSWSTTTHNVIKVFLALHLLAGIDQKIHFYNLLYSNKLWNKIDLLKYWSYCFLSTTQTWMQIILTEINCTKVRGIALFLVHQFKNVYMSTQHISIDEELLLWKGRLSLKQYIPSKHSSFGLKLFSLCEDSGYLWNSFVYL